MLLRPAVDRLIARTEAHGAQLRKLRVTLVSSTASGGGVSEMLHSLVPMCVELGVAARWLVMQVPAADAADFFPLTKALHNALHSAPAQPTLGLTAAQAAAFERVGAACARDLLARHLPPAEGVDQAGEIIIIHDPQPLAMAPHLRALLPHALLIWRCHIGGQRASHASKEAWAFAAPFLRSFDAMVFSNAQYFPPPCVAPQLLHVPSHVIMPGINPCSTKNRVLSVFEVASTLRRAGLLPPPPEIHTSGVACSGAEPFAPGAKIYLGDGAWQTPPLCEGRFVPFLHRPVITQVSRWDRLKVRRQALLRPSLLFSAHAAVFLRPFSIFIPLSPPLPRAIGLGRPPRRVRTPQAGQVHVGRRGLDEWEHLLLGAVHVWARRAF